MQQLIVDVQTLHVEAERLQGPSTMSRNASQPPSRDWKADRPHAREETRCTNGACQVRTPWVDTPDQAIEVRPETCARCSPDLHAEDAQRITRRQVTKLPEIKPVVIETRQPEVVCPEYQTVREGILPKGLDIGLSEGGAVSILECAEAAAQPFAEAIGDQVQQ